MRIDLAMHLGSVPVEHDYRTELFSYKHYRNILSKELNIGSLFDNYFSMA